MKPALIQRKTMEFLPTDDNVHIMRPELSVLNVFDKYASCSRTLDIGSLCYTKRGSKLPQHISCPVDLASLDKHRIPIARFMLEELRKRPASTAIGSFGEFSRFMDWIDAQEQAYEFNNIVSMRSAYFAYTANLLMRVRKSGINDSPIKLNTASSYQRAARFIIASTTGLSEKEVKGFATYITQNRGNSKHISLELPDSDTQARTFATLVCYVEEAYRVLVEGAPLPLKIVSPDNPTYYLWSVHFASKNPDHFSIVKLLESSPHFPSWADVTRHFGLDWRAATTIIERSRFDQTRYRIEDRNSDLRSFTRIRLGIHAITAGFLAFIAATGCNTSVAKQLRLTSLEIVPTTQGKRMSGVKYRAKGKTVLPEFGARFSSVFDKYLKIRDWLIANEKTSLVFPIPVSTHRSRDSISVVSTSALRAFKQHLGKVLPNTVWINPTQWRKNISYQYIKLSGGDMLLTAEKLGNTVETIRQSYSRPALEDYAKEMTSFFEAMHQSAIDRTRSASKIPVTILDESRHDSETNIGACTRKTLTEPEHANGFTHHAPTPNCESPETCIFCTHYGVHADAQDIRRLLSLRYIIEVTNDNESADHLLSSSAPTKHRIDEILSEIADTERSYADKITEINSEIATGKLDPFWAIHFDTLVVLGAIS